VSFLRHSVYACNELALHISFLFSAMLVHVLLSLFHPKGKNNSGTDSVNYRGIALSSMFCYIFDLMFLTKFSDCLLTSTLQFGFKPKHSRSMCSMVLDGGSAFCTLLDATKAFDRVNYCKLFSNLMSRSIPPAYLRLLLNMYTNSIARVCWNGVFSQSFKVENGVRNS